MLEIQGIRVEGGTKKETYIGPDKLVPVRRTEL